MPVDPTIIEAFIVDPGFTDQSKTINGILLDGNGQVASLTPKALSYFSQPATLTDKRNIGTRVVNWSAETSPQIVVDKGPYSQFVTDINTAAGTISAKLFKLIDKLMFNYRSSTTHSALEAELIGDSDISSIYVANSFKVAATIVAGSIHYFSGSSSAVNVPAFISFNFKVPKGSGTITYSLTLFASVDAWLTGYDISTIVKVIPPLPYPQLFNASLINSNDSIFSTASISATLSYNTTQALLGATSVSGITEYNAVLVDSASTTVSVPFNILYKGRSPTLSEIREAIRTQLLASGVGNASAWEERIPGVFVSGRFYLVPFWDLYYTKPDQQLFLSINRYDQMGEKMNVILASTGFGDLRAYADILSIYYNRMTMAAVPDLTGILEVSHLNTVIPDYQNFSPSNENFAYMSDASKDFAKKLNQIIAVDSGHIAPGIYIPTTENLLSFYSFVIGKYEICVITKACYETIMESIQ